MIAALQTDLAKFASDLVNWVWSPVLFFLLLGCGLIFSIATKFAQFRILAHGYSCIRGHYDDPNDAGQINHFQALCAALSATIGLGNIAGVAVAVSVGGPGAVFWMWVVGFFGMALKFMECTLAVMYRDIADVPDPGAPALIEADAEARTLEYAGEPPPEAGAVERARGEVRGGPMWYIQRALVEPLRSRGNIAWVVFKALAVCFALATVLNAFGGGNMYQGWNVANVLKESFGVPETGSAAVVSVLVALVIIGGIRRIGQVASKLVPGMCLLYIFGALYVVILNYGEIPHYLALIVKSALTPAAGEGAFAGVTVWMAFTWGLRRACFSNEAGEGSAAIAHAAARTDEPIREGVVAGIGPFIDTLVICTMSALVLLMTGTWNRPAVGHVSVIDGDRVTVACDTEVGPKIAHLYYDAVQSGAALAVYVEVRQGEEPRTVSGTVVDVNRAASDENIADRSRRTGEPQDRVQDWSGVRSLVLDVSQATGPARERVALLELGQPVHLDITGAKLTSFAFDTTVRGFGKYIVTIGVCLFAFSTMISWSYYGEKGAEYLLGPRAILPYKFVFVVFVFLGMVLEKFSTVYDFSDATTGLMVLCNLPAVLILSPIVIRAARNYFNRLDRGQMPRTR
jgi:AGCS family alanine or glycine:cation symporter